MHSVRKRVNKVAVVGAGTMGSGISQVFAQEGYQVILIDVSKDSLYNAQQNIKHTLSVFVDQGLLPVSRVSEIVNSIDFSDDLTRVRNADFILEAVPEVLETKSRVFKLLDQYTTPDVILATNTSGISISAIGSSVENPRRVVGMHWWNPPFVTPVVEIIKSNESSDEVLACTKNLVLKLKKKPVVVLKDIPGFLGNRMQYALMREALFLLENGVASAEDIDTMVKLGFGFKYPVLGPLETIDMAGLDIYHRVSQYLYQVLDDAKEPSAIVTQKMEQGHLGLKTQQGFYNYQGTDIRKLGQERMIKLIALLKCLELVEPSKEEAVK